MKKHIYLFSILFLALVTSGCYNPDISNEGVFEPAEQINKPRLIYPKSAQENEISGSPKVIILISKEGKVEKANIVKSSGYDVLDNAAIEYCKELLFNPAKRNGVEVTSVMQIDIKFNISEPEFNIKNYIKDVNNLYNEIMLAGQSAKSRMQNEILKKHDEFINNVKDGLHFNQYIREVLLPSTVMEWEKEWNFWPLSFLLYHDFITRFKDYDSLDLVKLQLKNSLKEDIKYINHSDSNDTELKKSKENILKKIKGFIKNHYPDIEIDEISHDA